MITMPGPTNNPPDLSREEERFLFIDRISKRFDQVEFLA